MTDTHVEDLLRSKMLKMDKIIHTCDSELLQYIVYAVGHELEKRSQEYMADQFDKIRVKIKKDK